MFKTLLEVSQNGHIRIGKFPTNKSIILASLLHILASLLYAAWPLTLARPATYPEVEFEDQELSVVASSNRQDLSVVPVRSHRQH